MFDKSRKKAIKTGEELGVGNPGVGGRVGR